MVEHGAAPHGEPAACCFGGDGMSLKVWGGNECGMWHTIVAARSKIALREIMGLSRGEVDNYWSETGNDAEIALATRIPGVLWHQGIGMWWWPSGEGWHEGKGAACLRCHAYRLAAYKENR